jgi:hypothetical protein
MGVNPVGMGVGHVFVKFHAQKQIGKSHVIDIFTSEDMENISLCIFSISLSTI